MISNKKLVFCIFLSALFVRLLYVLIIPQLSLAGSDAIEYDVAAERLLSGKGLPLERLADNQVEIVRPPLFPMFLAGIYVTFGHHYTAVRIVHALLSALLVFFIYYLTLDIFKKEAVALIACLLCSFYPPLIAYTGLLYSETVFIFFLMLAMFFLNSAAARAKPGFYALTGFSLGIATMVSSRSLYIPVFILAGLLCAVRAKKTVVKGFCQIVIVMMLVFSPWTIRNYFVSGGKFILLENYSSETALWLATNPQGEILKWSYDKEPLKSLVGNLPLAQRTPVIRKEAINNLKRYPLAYFRNSFKRFFVLLIASHSNCFYGFEKSLQQTISEGQMLKASVKAALFFLNVVVIFLGFFGMWLFRKEWRSSIVLLIPIYYTLLLHTFYVAAPRLQIPMMPFLIMFAAFGMVRITESFKKRCAKLRSLR